MSDKIMIKRIDEIISTIKKDLKHYSSIGLSTDHDLEVMEMELNTLIDLRTRGYISSPEVDELIYKITDLVERRYTYLEEVASLGNNWW
jgi:chorismate mutase